MTALSRTLQRLSDHRPFLYLAVLALQLRLLAVLLFRPGGYLTVFSDFPVYLDFARLSDQGLYPYLHYWSEYPPLFPWLAVGLYRLTAGIPPTFHPLFWFHLALGGLLAVADTLTLALLYALALRLADRQRALHVAGTYALLFAPLYILTAWFDPLAVLLFVASAHLLIARRWAASGGVAALGALVKLFPGLIVPVALKVWWEGAERRPRHLLRLAAGSAAIIAVVMGPLLVLSPDFTLASMRGLLRRSSWQTVWALLEGYYWVGWAGGDRLDPGTAGAPLHAGTLPWGVLTGLFLAGFLLLLRRRLKDTGPLSVLAFAGLSLHYLLLISKGWSPQFLSWVLPLLVLLLPTARAVLYALALTLLTFLEAPFYIVILPDVHWVLVVTVLGRTAILLAVGLEYASLAYGLPVSQRAFQRLAWVAAAGLVLFLVAGTPALARAYVETRRVQIRYAPIVDLVAQASPDGTLLLAETRSAFDRLRPLAPPDVRVALGTAANPTLPLSRWVQEAGGDLWLCSAERESAAGAELGGQMVEIASFSLPPCWLRHFVLESKSGIYHPVEPSPQAGELARMSGLRVEETERTLRIHLLWTVIGTTDVDYTVFVHLLAASDVPASQRDGQPCQGFCPTSTWRPGEVIEDVREIDLPPGQDVTRLALGLYRLDTLERLPLFLEGEPLADARFVLLLPAR